MGGFDGRSRPQPLGSCPLAVSVESFVRGLMLRHHLWQALEAVLLHVLGVGLLLLAAGAWLPFLLEPLSWAAAGWVSFVVLRELLAVVLRRRRLRVRDVDVGLEMQDMLTTLLSQRQQTPAAAWLRRNVSTRLARAPVQQRRYLWWRACRRAVVLVPLVVLVLWLGPLWNLLPLGLKPSGDSATAKGAGTGTGSGHGTASQPASEQPDQPKQPKQPKEQPAGGQQPGGDPQPPPRPAPPPKPLIEKLPIQKEFVVPTWIHEGPSTKARAPVVEQDQPGAQRPQPQPRPRTGPEAAEQQLREFQRAAERAQHARHVPPAERPFVRRYFGQLVESGRRR